MPMRISSPTPAPERGCGNPRVRRVAIIAIAMAKPTPLATNAGATPKAAIRRPPMLGPTMRAPLKEAEFSDTALLRSERPTISATKDCRAGLSSTLASPTPVASTATCQYCTWPEATSAARARAWQPSTVWVTIRSRRLGRRSARAPDTIEKRRIGPNWRVPIRPSLSGESVSWSTSHDWATVCIHEPIWATSCAAKNRRKSAWRNARSPVGSAIGGRSAADHALGVDEDRVERLARGEEEPVAPQAPEAEVGAALGEQVATDDPTVGIVDRDPVEPLAPTPAAPEVAVGVAAHPVRDAGSRVDEDAAVGERGAVVDHVEDADLARHRPRHHHVEAALVGREAETVGPRDVAGDHGGLTGARIEAVDVGGQLDRGHVALVVAEDAEGRIGEPHAVVGLHHHVVGRVEPLVLEAVHQDGDGPVVLGAGHPPAVVLAGDEPALAVAGVAVGVARRLAEDRDRPRLLVPAHDAVVGDVAPEHVAPVPEPYRALGPAEPGGEPLHRRVEDTVLGEALVEDLERGIGIAHRRGRHGSRMVATPAGDVNGLVLQSRVDEHTRGAAPLQGGPGDACAHPPRGRVRARDPESAALRDPGPRHRAPADPRARRGGDPGPLPRALPGSALPRPRRGGRDARGQDAARGVLAGEDPRHQAHRPQGPGRRRAHPTGLSRPDRRGPDRSADRAARSRPVDSGDAADLHARAARRAAGRRLRGPRGLQDCLPPAQAADPEAAPALRRALEALPFGGGLVSLARGREGAAPEDRAEGHLTGGRAAICSGLMP